jgi:methionyl aminopeptidase
MENLLEKLSFYKNLGYPTPSKKIIKTEAQIEGMRKSGKLTRKILDELTLFIKPGITTNSIDAFVHKLTIQEGGVPAPLGYKGYPKSTCVSVNEVICHGIPSDRILKDGDIVNVDVTCILNQFYADSCRMYLVGNVSNDAMQLVNVAKKCLEEGIKAIKPWQPLNVIGDAIQKIADTYGYSIVEDFGGHGVGLEFHEDPFVCHYAKKEKQMVMIPGMTFTIEPMINQGVKGCKILKDNWTAVTKDGKLSAQWEHTIAVTNFGSEILTH